jgi:hypothetical protein
MGRFLKKMPYMIFSNKMAILENIYRIININREDNPLDHISANR